MTDSATQNITTVFNHLWPRDKIFINAFHQKLFCKTTEIKNGITCISILCVANASKDNLSKVMIVVKKHESLFVGGQVLLEVLAHAEGLHPLVSENGLHGGVGGKVLLVLRVLEVVLLQVSPEPLDHLGPGDLLPALGPDDGGELFGDIQLHVNTGLLWERHYYCRVFKSTITKLSKIGCNTLK